MLSIDSAHPQKVDGMHRNRWTAYSGFSGRLAPESVVAIDRITHTLATSVFGAPSSEVSLGLVSFKERFVDYRIYSEEEIRLAQQKLQALLHSLGY